jgi:hypothetical protein
MRPIRAAIAFGLGVTNVLRPATSLDAAHWRQRARQARALAEQIADLEARARMLRNAADYEKLAEKAAADTIKTARSVC